MTGERRLRRAPLAKRARRRQIVGEKINAMLHLYLKMHNNIYLSARRGQTTQKFAFSTLRWGHGRAVGVPFSFDWRMQS